MQVDKHVSSIRHLPGMRSEYSWLPPDGAETVTKPHHVGVSFSAHRQVGYELDGHAQYLTIPAGVVFTTGAQEVRWTDVSEPTEALEIYPDLELLRGVIDPPDPGSVHIEPAAAVHDATVLSIAAVLKRHHVHDGSGLDAMHAGTLAHRLVAHLAHHYCHPAPRRQPRAGHVDRALVDRLARFVDDRLSEQLTLEDLATEARLSVYHFARAFKSSTGMSPHEFVTMRRMERAKAMLLATRLSVPAVAYAVGYFNISHFRRMFRRCTGFACADLRPREQLTTASFDPPLPALIM